MKSDLFTSSNVALKDSINCVGIFLINPTVSINPTLIPFFKNILLILVSNV